MTVTVRVPAALRALVGGRSELAASPGSLRDVLEGIGRESPALRERIVGDDGALRRHVNVFVNDEDVRFRELLETPIRDGDRVTIVPAIAGGWQVGGRIEVDAGLPAVALPTAVLNEVFAHAREAEPEECCGLITGDDDEPYRHVVRCRNEMTAWHQRDPETYPRDGTQGFYMNEQDYLRAEDEASARGERVTCVYHSHVEAGAYFSEMDQDFAGQSLFPFPDADHLVVSVVGGKVVDQALFRRDAGGFVGRLVAHGGT